jgi:hypothetical protein
MKISSPTTLWLPLWRGFGPSGSSGGRGGGYGARKVKADAVDAAGGSGGGDDDIDGCRLAHGYGVGDAAPCFIGNDVPPAPDGSVRSPTGGKDNDGNGASPGAGAQPVSRSDDGSVDFCVDSSRDEMAVAADGDDDGDGDPTGGADGVLPDEGNNMPEGNRADDFIRPVGFCPVEFCPVEFPAAKPTVDTPGYAGDGGGGGDDDSRRHLDTAIASWVTPKADNPTGSNDTVGGDNGVCPVFPFSGVSDDRQDCTHGDPAFPADDADSCVAADRTGGGPGGPGDTEAMPAPADGGDRGTGLSEPAHGCMALANGDGDEQGFGIFPAPAALVEAPVGAPRRPAARGTPG